MALQDLTPQLRTRLSRLERVVGVFVAVATLLLVVGLVYYIYQRAQTKGWGKRTLPYFTFVDNAAGIKVGQKVKLMGFDAGEVTQIEAQEPGSFFNVFIAMKVIEPYDGYLWEDSRAKIGASDFLGNRFIELTKGTNGPATYIFHPIKEVTLQDAAELLGNDQLFFAEEVYDQYKTNLITKSGRPLSKQALDKIMESPSVATIHLYDKSVTSKKATGLWDFRQARYVPPERDIDTLKGYYLEPDESPALGERLEKVANLVEAALPGILDLTNQLRRVLENAAVTTARADDILISTRPIIANLNRISEQLSDPRGSFGEWLIPPDMSRQITQALTSANSTLISANTILTNSDAQITTLAIGLDQTIENLASITSNLHQQVKANTNVVSEISRLIIDTDDMVQGLKRHWLLRSAFKSKTSTAQKTTGRTPARSPKDSAR